MRTALALLGTCLAWGALAQPAWSPAMLGLAQPAPGLQIAFTRQYPGAVPHAAFAFAQDSAGRAAWGIASGAVDEQAAATAALADCRQEAAARDVGAACQVLARDATLGDAPSAPMRQQGIGPFSASPLHRHWGVAQARGVLVWGHGSAGPRGTDLRATAAPGLVSALNEAGWDVLRFDRAPADDRLADAVARLEGGLEALHAAGYARVVLGGQSRGGWQSLLAAAERPALVDAVIALSPAAWGRVAGNGRAPEALAAFRAMLERLREAPMRLAVAVFDDDPYDPDPGARAGLLAGLDQHRAAPVLALWPEMAKGHGGGEDWHFTQAMAGCLVVWLNRPAPEAPRGLHRVGCGPG